MTDDDLAALGIQDYWKSGKYCKVTSITTIDNISHQKLAKIAQWAQCTEKEVPMIGGSWKVSLRVGAPLRTLNDRQSMVGERWVLVTTRRLCWGIGKEIIEAISVENIFRGWAVPEDNPGMRRRHGFNGVRILRIELLNDSPRFMPVKGGMAVIGLTNMLSKLARRRQSMIEREVAGDV